MAYLSHSTLRQMVPLSNLRSSNTSWQIQWNTPHVWVLEKAPGAETSSLLTALDLPRSARPMEGTRLLAVEIWYQISSAAAVAFSAALYRLSLPGQGGSLTGAQAISAAYDAAHDTAAKRAALGLHRLMLTPGEMKFGPADEVCFLELTVQTGSSSQVQILGVQMHYALRL